MNALLIAAPQSGSGKTLVSLALMAYLSRQGLQVQAYKVGPDFIDPGHHRLLTRRLSHNLDGWMLRKEVNQEIFYNNARGADWLIVEGVMGLFDGYSPVDESGSTAQMAKWLDLPVCLLVDVRAMARSAAALLRGFIDFDPELHIAGVIFNRVGSAGHARILRETVEHYLDIPCLGCLPRVPGLQIPSRHLGLVTAEDAQLGDNWADDLADWVGPAVDWSGLTKISASCSFPCKQEAEKDRCAVFVPEISEGEPVRIAVARDQAFCFYYEQNLRLLKEAGAVLCFFSPLTDRTLPDGVAGLYLGGGYPELFAARLAANTPLRDQIRSLAGQGMPVYAECGGFMYLLHSLEDLAGDVWPMAGVFPFQAKMGSSLQALGYREVRTTALSLLGPPGTVVRGHEFHYSFLHNKADRAEDVENIYSSWDRKGKDRDCAGWLSGNVLGSYVHLHFGSNISCARHLVQYCFTWQRGS